MEVEARETSSERTLSIGPSKKMFDPVVILETVEGENGTVVG